MKTASNKNEMDLRLHRILNTAQHRAGEKFTVTPCNCEDDHDKAQAVHIEVEGPEHRAKIIGALLAAGVRHLGFGPGVVHADCTGRDKAAWVIGSAGRGDRLFPDGGTRFRTLHRLFERTGFRRLSLRVERDVLAVDGGKLRPNNAPDLAGLAHLERRKRRAAKRDNDIQAIAKKTGLPLELAREFAAGLAASA